MTVLVPQKDTLLVVTADHDLWAQFVDLLENDLASLVCCQDVASAMEILTRQPFDLVLIDERLPDNGFASQNAGIGSIASFAPVHMLCEVIRSRTELPEIPVMVVLAEDDDDRIEAAFSHGATDYLIQPLRPPIVRQRVHYLLHIKEAQTHLYRQEERYRIISNSVSDYAYSYRVDADGRTFPEWSTKAYEMITGYRLNPDEEIKDNWARVVHPDDAYITQERWERLIHGERDVSEFRILTSRGNVRWMRDHGQPTFDSYTGRVNRIYGMVHDITDYKHSETMMQAKTDELEERNQELDAFAHTVAHDLKNPIASMMGFASLVLNYYDRMSEERLREHLTMIMESGYKAKDIINSLLLLASVHKQEDLLYTPLSMHDIINEVLRRYINMIRDYRAEIILPEEFPMAVGYAPWVEEVWSNYFSNALKYGGRPPRVTFGAEELHDGMIMYYIMDNGEGLTLEERDRAFLPFTRFSQAKIDGHGLGLSVVHRIVTKLGGEVSVEPVASGGCKFTFTLPAVAKAAQVGQR